MPDHPMHPPVEGPHSDPPVAGLVRRYLSARLLIWVGACWLAVTSANIQAQVVELHSGLPTAGGAFGAALGTTADLNGDGVPDLLVGAPHEVDFPTTVSTGRVHVFSGA